MPETVPIQDAVTLSNCDKEPIHIIGSIQPCGVLLALDHDWSVRQCSANAESWFDRPVQTLRTTSLADLLGDAARDVLGSRSRIGATFPRQSEPLTLGGEPFEARSHVNDDGIPIVELERRLDARSFGDLRSDTLVAFARCEAEAELANLAADALHDIAGYQRTMVYKFHPDGSGEVIAERCGAGLDPYLGLRYPASDVPQQARALYVRNRVRQLFDVDAPPVAIVPTLDPASDRPLDLSDTVLRSSSPIHVQYLQNMGVRSTLGASITVGRRLWGMLICHGFEPRWSPPETRDTVELLATLFSTQVEMFESREVRRRFENVRRLQTNFVAVVSETDAESRRKAQGMPDLLRLIEADGVAICSDHLWTLGATPEPDTIRALSAWIASRETQEIFQTDRLGELWTDHALNLDEGAGVLSIPLTPDGKAQVIWFRRAEVTSVRWAGNPNKPVEVREGNLELAPRKSFDLWQETVGGRARPWQTWDLDIAAVLGQTVAVSGLNRLVEASEQARRASDERFDLAVEGANDGVWEWPDAASDDQWWSDRFYEMLGHRSHELRPSLETLRSLVHAEDRAALLGAVRSCVSSGGHLDVQCRLRHASGESRWFLIRGAGIRREGGPMGLAGTLTDVHRRKLAEESLREANAVMARKNRQLERFAYIASHDLREPMRQVATYAELLGERFANAFDEKGRRYLGHLTGGAQRMRAQIEALLEYTRAGAPSAQRGPVDTRAVVERSLGALRLAIEDTGAEIVVADLPTLEADSSQLDRVFQNLIANALKFRREGVKPRVDINARRRADAWVFSVADNGIGIEKRHTSRIFEVFHRLHAAEAYPGSGIGLAICAQIVEAHFGRIWVESEPGQGSVFCFTLPATTQTPSHTSPAPSLREAQ